MAVQFNSVKIAVSDLQRATDFYVAALGLTPGPHYSDSEWGLLWPNGDQPNLVLLADPDGVKGPKLGPACLVFWVPDAAKLGDRLRDAGYEGISDATFVDQYGITCVLATDPDGNTLELLSR